MHAWKALEFPLSAEVTAALSIAIHYLERAVYGPERGPTMNAGPDPLIVPPWRVGFPVDAPHLDDRAQQHRATHYADRSRNGSATSWCPTGKWPELRLARR